MDNRLRNGLMNQQQIIFVVRHIQNFHKQHTEMENKSYWQLMKELIKVAGD